MNTPEVIIRRSDLMLVSRAPSLFCQPIYFLFSSLALLDILPTANNVGGSLNIASDDQKLLWLNGLGIADVHVTDLHPLLPAEVGCLCILAIWALDFDNTAAFP